MVSDLAVSQCLLGQPHITGIVFHQQKLGRTPNVLNTAHTCTFLSGPG